eukprot:TRINITY_DN5474_c1_g1_i1.p1 TRINITY_DN5474_c1_g1~~TRINITY_DN5474_c1_g1_i1.p1  ORF type:complete len:128 (-),score=2.99 TRINITY_DN5474_c1_g1_i1:135-518(-)
MSNMWDFVMKFFHSHEYQSHTLTPEKTPGLLRDDPDFGRQFLPVPAGFCRFLPVSAGFGVCRVLPVLPVSAGFCQFLLVSAGVCQSAGFCRFLADYAGFWRIMPVSGGFCQFLAVSAGFCQFLPVFL